LPVKIAADQIPTGGAVGALSCSSAIRTGGSLRRIGARGKVYLPLALPTIEFPPNSLTEQLQGR